MYARAITSVFGETEMFVEADGVEPGDICLDDHTFVTTLPGEREQTLDDGLTDTFAAMR